MKKTKALSASVVLALAGISAVQAEHPIRGLVQPDVMPGSTVTLRSIDVSAQVVLVDRVQGPFFQQPEAVFYLSLERYGGEDTAVVIIDDSAVPNRMYASHNRSIGAGSGGYIGGEADKPLPGGIRLPASGENISSGILRAEQQRPDERQLLS